MGAPGSKWVGPSVEARPDRAPVSHTRTHEWRAFRDSGIPPERDEMSRGRMASFARCPSGIRVLALLGAWGAGAPPKGDVMRVGRSAAPPDFRVPARAERGARAAGRGPPHLPAPGPGASRLTGP